MSQQRRAEARQPSETIDPARRRRAGEGLSRRVSFDGPAFINDRAEEQHHLDLLSNPRAEPAARVAARLELAHLYERYGHFAEAAEMYERNVWEGVRTPATYAGLASAYRELGRNDLAEAALEQVRREGGASRRASAPTAAQSARTATLPRVTRAGSVADTLRVSPPATAPGQRPTSQRSTGEANRQTRRDRATQRLPESAGAVAATTQLQRPAAALLAGQTRRGAVVAASVLLPILLGLGIFVAVVMTQARPRTSESPPATAAPVATVAPTPVPNAAPTPAVPPALAQPPAPARLVVSNVGPEGLSLRRTPSTNGQRIKVWSDGTEMADLGETTEQGGKTWRKVRDPDGNVGWTAADFLTDPATRTPAPSGPAFDSGGLGLARADWERAHGQPNRSGIFFEYDGGRLVVGLLEGNIWHIERIWMRTDAASLEAARQEARAYLPADVSLVQSVDRGDARLIDVYSSTALASRFGSTAWNGGKVGTFSIQYRFRSGADRMVVSAMFRLGDALY